MPLSTYSLVFNCFSVIFDIIRPPFTIAMVTDLPFTKVNDELFVAERLAVFCFLSN